MKLRVKFTAVLLLFLAASPASAGDADSKKDPRALETLNQMAAYTGAIDKFVINGEVYGDARMDAGLIVSNPSEILIKIDRPGSLYLQAFDGLYTVVVNKDVASIDHAALDSFSFPA